MMLTVTFRQSLVAAMATLLAAVTSPLLAQPTPVTIKDGVMQWQDGSQVALFGVNYAMPFAFGYRAVKQLGLDPQAVIDMDVNHIARLGLDAYRVHVWERLISDKHGNLLDNEQLRLFDYLQHQLALHGIKTIITPIAWWGSGYPAADPKEPGFSVDYSKAQMNQDPKAIAATINYLRQLLTHKNPYTGKTLATDANVIAFELFNEPKHTQSPQQSAAYVEQLLATVRGLGVTKPLFYNISEQGNDQAFAHALCNSSVDGVAYQWYPTGLVKNSALHSNMLPAVAHYTDPFKQISACQHKAKMVYEFDAADVTRSVMYPAMARSFREAGFQWATQFAYDSAALAQTNAEYNTHYLNLLYTPAKAISFMIAATEFRQLPLGYHAKEYPASNRFDHTLLDYQADLSQYDDGDHYYYSNNTQQAPQHGARLQHIAGVGSSPLVAYRGNGAYFLDKLQEGVWRLEVYPDLLQLQDPHQPSSLQREVGRLYLHQRQMTLMLADLGETFAMKGINSGNDVVATAEHGKITVKPGVYLLGRTADLINNIKNTNKAYYLPQIPVPKLALVHQPQRQRNLGDKLSFSAQIAGIKPQYQVTLYLRYQGDKAFTALPMSVVNTDTYRLTLPDTSAWRQPGILEYAISVNDGLQNITWPGAQAGTPADWDYVDAGYWHTLLTPTGTPVTLLAPATDRTGYYTPKNTVSWPATSATVEGATLKLLVEPQVINNGGNLLRLDLANDNQLIGRDLRGYNALALRIRAFATDHLQLGIIGNDGLAWGTDVSVASDWKTLVLPLDKFQPIGTMLGQAYPTFMPVTVGPFASQSSLALNAIEGLQLSLPPLGAHQTMPQRGIEIAEVALVQMSAKD
ncbi:hypothetical protein KDN34_07510 [Shewanella yunxiaonensis]|uniref:Glycoside hydrolase family 5 domain-containing protein n=1 Tax=Shewanella yunxiaonensis TaxID=2829809 RepID=A0ABX7YWU0_9GAMM|nr:hypothetical protein [Shewanella yunxiaonensis]QUN07260.1 hypothetical protein KDN34_07510 [Shewanella yunxiaonensis]